ncbi:FtsW/RodA/SpoVE family cell cycle protein [Jatrophihabitans fulvus]
MTASGLNPMQRIPTRRNVEIVMLVFAVLIVVMAEVAVEAARDGKLQPSRLATYAAVPLVLGAITHLLIRRFAKYADPLMLPVVVLLNGLGLVMIHRLDLGEKQQDPNFPNQAPKQVVWIALGLALFVVVLLVVRDHRVLQRYAYTLALIGLFFLMLPVVLPAKFSEIPEAPGARIWIRLAGFQIQPGEFAKILLTIFAASYLVQKRDVLALAGRKVLGLTLPRARDLGPLLVAWLLCIGVLVRGSDLGTSLLFFGLFVVLIYVATERASWAIIGIVLFAGGAYIAYQIFSKVQERVSVWLHPFSDVTVSPGYDPTFQLRQSLFGLGTGGIFGTGLGSGHPELVPLPATDFIISSFGEETGIFGLGAILTLYGVLVARGFAAGLGVRDGFGKLLACGLSWLFAFQIFVVVAGVTRLLPATGLTTPFLSYGGSSMLGSWAILALLVRVSDAARRPLTTPPSASPPEGHTAGQEAVRA